MQPQYITLNRRAKDITGQRFERLVALGPIGHNKRGAVIWLCLCDCGSTTSTLVSYLYRGDTTSCGCAKKDAVAAIRKTHGMGRTPLYRTWCGIITRCTNPNRDNYARYGGRGITICGEWRHDFMAFHDYVSALPDYGEKGYTLDRIDNDGNYEPGNMRWASPKTQNDNRRVTRLIAYDGKTQTITAWAKELGIPQSTLFKRFNRGWSAHEALTTSLASSA